MYFKYIFQKFLRNIARVKLRVVLTAALAHGIMSYWMMKAANEADLVASPIEFFYFWVVTSSTVGYGDASPTTEAGMLISALFDPFFTRVVRRITNQGKRHLDRDTKKRDDGNERFFKCTRSYFNAGLSGAKNERNDRAHIGR